MLEDWQRYKTRPYQPVKIVSRKERRPRAGVRECLEQILRVLYASVRSAADRWGAGGNCLAGLFFEGWQERGELVGGGEGEFGQGLLEPGPGVRAELLACGCEARQDCQATTAIVATKE